MTTISAKEVGELRKATLDLRRVSLSLFHSMGQTSQRILNGPKPRRHSAWPAGLVTFASFVCLAATLMVSTGNSVVLAETATGDSRVDSNAKDSSDEDQIQLAVFAAIEESLNAEIDQASIMDDQPETDDGEIKKGDQQGTVAGENGDHGWGPPPKQGNLRLRLTLKANEVKEGQPVLASLEIKNFGDAEESYDSLSFGTNGYSLKVKHADGESDQYLASPVGTMGTQRQLKPGQSVFIFKDYNLGTVYLLDQGKYSVQAVGHSPRKDKKLPESKIQTLSVSKGQQTPYKRFMKSLIAQSPDWWQVTYNC